MTKQVELKPDRTAVIDGKLRGAFRENKPGLSSWGPHGRFCRHLRALHRGAPRMEQVSALCPLSLFHRRSGDLGRTCRSEPPSLLGEAVSRLEIALGHSRSASARAKNASGILRPICFALFRLTASSNFVVCSMGKSFGCPPSKILCTYLALRRSKAGPSAPYDIRPPASTKARVIEAAGKRCSNPIDAW
jgi:hypothetical protein